MTTLTATATATATASDAGKHARPSTPYRLSAVGVLQSEWTKFRSLRSSWITLGISMSLVLVISTLMGMAMRSKAQPADLAQAVDVGLIGFSLAALVLGVLGALQVSGEYATGMIRASMTTVPPRLPVLFAKAAVVAVVTSISMVITSLGAFFLSQSFLGSAYSTSLGDPGVLRAVLGNAGFVTAVAVIAVGLAALIRSTAGTITALAAALFVIPPLMMAVPKSISQHITPYLPSSAGASLYSTNPDTAISLFGGAPGPNALSSAGGAALLLVYVAVALGLGALALKRRDV
jgi:ABC-2 type transport system permease protein